MFSDAFVQAAAAATFGFFFGLIVTTRVFIPKNTATQFMVTLMLYGTGYLFVHEIIFDRPIVAIFGRMVSWAIAAYAFYGGFLIRRRLMDFINAEWPELHEKYPVLMSLL